MAKRLDIDINEAYSKPDLYEETYGAFKGDIPFYVERAKAAGGPVLEMMCGSGRLTLPIAQAGVDVTGLDDSKTMLDKARQKGRDLNVSVNWVKGDCRTVRLDRQFNLVFVAYHSFHHLVDQASVENFFFRVIEHMSGPAKFIMDVYNPCREDFGLPEPEHKSTMDPETLFHSCPLTWYPNNKRDGQISADLRYCLYPLEIQKILKLNGLYIEEKYGDFDRSPLGPRSLRQIYVCRKYKS